MSAELRSLCTKPDARWCPNHGRCTCPDDWFNNLECPLHGPDSKHTDAEEWHLAHVHPIDHGGQ